MSNEGDYIKIARQKAGLTQKQLAEKVGLATITIQQYERNLREPRLENCLLYTSDAADEGLV